MKPHAKKRFGQHFLHDPGTIERIVRAIDPQPGDRLVEVGPGRGAITAPCSWRAGALDVVEIDADVVPRCEQHCAGRGELRVHLADALEFDFRALRGDGPRLRLVGNLPYNISTPLLFHFIAQLDAIADMHFMLQTEVVTRMAAAPGRRATTAGSPSCSRPTCASSRCSTSAPGAFRRRPKVVSTFFALHPHRRRRFRPRTRRSSRASSRPRSRSGARRCAIRCTALLDARQIVAAGVDPGPGPRHCRRPSSAHSALQVQAAPPGL